jgi:excinuclease UvrABC nuclease subunit
VLVRTLTFSPHQDEGFFQELPAAPAVFLLRGDGEPYVSKSANLRRRLMRLLGPPREQSKRLNLRDHVREVEFTATGSDFESQFLLHQLLRDKFPKTYSNRLRFRFAHLIKLHLENEYPRASVTTRLGSLVSRTESSHASEGLAAAEAATSLTPLTARLEAVPFQSSLRSAEGIVEGAAKPSSLARPDGRGRPSPHGPSNLYYGPFPSRAAAEKFASDALDFFKMRRCVDDLHPDPAFPGCVYSEMKMCLAPCFKGCTDSDYHAEVARVQAFFESGGDSLTRELAQHRDHASIELAFEDAAAVHARIEKLKPLVAQLPEIVRRIDRLDAIVIQPSVKPDSVSLFRFTSGCFNGPALFSIQPAPSSGSMESRVEEAIRSFSTPEIKPSLERMEHLALLKRWYYRSSRIGEIFFADEKGAWPLRKIVRGIGRVYHGEKPQDPSTFPATQPEAPPSHDS